MLHLGFQATNVVQGPKNKSTAARTLVSGMMLSWGVPRPLPDIAVRQSLGQAGELEVETKASKLHKAVPQHLIVASQSWRLSSRLWPASGHLESSLGCRAGR